MRIGVDLDGVCYDFAASLRTYLVAFEGFEPFDLPETRTWNFFKEQWGISLEDYLEYYRRGVDAGVVLRVGGAHENCAETISDLRRDGNTIHIVTYRDVGTRSAQSTVEWLKQEGIEYDSLTFSKDKTVVPTDVFIEDNVDNFVALESAGTRSVLMNRPWNSQHDTEHRVSSWDEFYLYVNRF